MDLKFSAARLSRETIDEASQWFIEIRSGDLDAAAREAFMDWLRRSPEHIQGYLEIAATWSEIPTQDPGKHIDIEDYLARARAEQGVAQLRADYANTPAPRADSPRSSHRWRWAAAASIAAVVAVAAWFVPSDETYATRVGEQRTIELSDGSAVELNARSKVRVHMTDMERDVQLIDGQALFRVAKDHVRPFIVSAGDTRVRAIGTQFDVYKERDRTTITVIEGRVAVSSASQEAPASALLIADQQLIVTAQADVPRQPVRADASKATAWVQKRLIFEDTPLAKVAEEFNRYNTRALIIEGEALRGIRISGVYSSTDPTALLEFLRNYPDIRVIETAREIRVARLH